MLEISSEAIGRMQVELTDIEQALQRNRSAFKKGAHRHWEFKERDELLQQRRDLECRASKIRSRQKDVNRARSGNPPESLARCFMRAAREMLDAETFAMLTAAAGTEWEERGFQ